MLQVVSDFLDVDDEFATLRADGRAVGPAAVVLPRPQPDAARRVPRRSSSCITEANADGLTMTGQVAPRAVGLILGLECTLHPFLTEPRVPRDRATCRSPSGSALLRDPEFRARVLQSADERATRQARRLRCIGRFDLLFELADPPDYEPTLDATRSAPGPPARGVAAPTSSHST